MTLGTTETVVRYDGDNSTTVFDVTFEFHATSDLEVIVVTEATGAESLKSLGGDYSVDGGDGGTGQVTMNVAPTTAERLVIRRLSPDVQPDDLIDGGALAAEPLERRLDIITARLQELETDIARALKVAKGSQVPESGLTLNLKGGMGTILQVASDEQGVILATGSVPDNVVTSPFGETWVGLADPPAGRSNLGLTDAAITALGTSGATIPLLNGNNTYSGNATFQADSVCEGRVLVNSVFRLGEEILTIADGSVTPARANLLITTEGGASTDNLDNIVFGIHPVGSILELRANNFGQAITVRHNGAGSGNIYLAGNANAVLDDRDKTLWLQRRSAGEHGAGWYEIGRSAPMAPQLLHVRSVAAPGGGGGTPVLNNWVRSILNDFVFNEIPGASLASSVLTLPAGVYVLSGFRSFYRTSQSRVRLQNLTDNNTLVLGMPGFSPPSQQSPGNSDGDQIHTPLQGRFVLNATKAIDLQYLVRFVGSGQAGFGLGFPANDGQVEIYADLMFQKIS